jgi:hypothetical protein
MDEPETMALLIRRTSLGRLKGWGKRGEMREGEMDEDSEGMGEEEEEGEGVVEEEDLSRILQSPDLGSGDRTLISGNHPSPISWAQSRHVSVIYKINVHTSAI